MVGDVGQRFLRVVHDVDAAQEGLHRQPRGVAGAAAGGQHVVGAGRVVAQRDRGVGTDEDGARVAHPGRPGGGVRGLDLQVLGGVRVDDGEAVVERVDQHDAGLPAAQRLGDALTVLGGGHLRLQLGLDRLGQRLGGRDQDGGGHHVVLGLADQVGGDVTGVGGVVGEDRDLGRTRLGVDADDALEQALGGGDVDVARPGDQLDGGALLGPVREHRDGLGAARRVDLVDAQQRAGGEDRGVREVAEGGLRRGGDRQSLDAGLLRGHHVHHHGGRVDGPAARHVEADPLDGHPALGDGAAGDDPHRRVGAPLVTVDETGPADRLLQRRANGGVQLLQRPAQGLGGHPQALQPYAVELLRGLDHSGCATMPYVLAEGPHLLQGGLDIQLGTGQQVTVDSGRRRAGGGRLSLRPGAGGGTTQIDSGDHTPKSLRPARRTGARIRG